MRASCGPPTCPASAGTGLYQLKHLRPWSFAWLARLKAHRQVELDRNGCVAIRDPEVPPQGREVHLRGYGFVRVFRTLAPDCTVAHWFSSDLQLTRARRQELAAQTWAIETYDRGLEQCCGVEKVKVRSARTQAAHINFAIRAFLCLEPYGLCTGLSCNKVKTSMLREAVR